MVALLVSTSMMSWSAATSSPALMRKVMTVASAMDSPNCGMMMGICGIHGYIRNRLRAAATMLRAVGRCTDQRLG